MNFNKLTIKASEAIQEANNICINQKNPQITTPHLLYAMLEQADGYLPAILKNLKANEEQIKAETIMLIDKLPKTTGNIESSISKELEEILATSEQQMQKMWDSYITTEHFFLALLKVSSDTKSMLEKLWISYESTYTTILNMRNGEIILKSALKLYLNMEKILLSSLKKASLILLLEEMKNFADLCRSFLVGQKIILYLCESLEFEKQQLSNS